MADFCAVFGSPPAAIAPARALRARPGMADRAVHEGRFGWGTVWAQTDDRLDRGGALAFACGRPSAGDGDLEGLLARGLEGDGWARAYDALSGAFVLVACDAGGVTIATDPMGVYPVYAARGAGLQVVGTSPELVAALAGIADDLDPVSLAEILVRRSPTPPFTTRRALRELDPGAVHRIAADAPAAPRSRGLWRPEEGEPAPRRAVREALRAALEGAAARVTRGPGRVSVLLSGGKDSRVVQALVPRDRRGPAVTFAGDEENRELDVARRVAAAEGVGHRVLRRRDDFYAEPLLREHRLLGAERAAGHGHGLVLLDAPPLADAGVLVGGFLSDTLLRGYSPRAGGFDAWMPDAGELGALRGEVREEVLERGRAWRARLAAFRPRTASAWSWFYPVSRQRAAGHVHVLQRLAAADELFLHRPIVELAAAGPPAWTDADLDAVFAALCPRSARVPLANTGAPLGAPRWREALARAGTKLGAGRGGRAPWHTNGSWPSWRRFVARSPAWHGLRARAAGATRAAEVLDPLLEQPIRSLLAEGAARHGFRFEMGLVFLALHLEAVRGGAPGAAASPAAR